MASSLLPAQRLAVSSAEDGSQALYFAIGADILQYDATSKTVDSLWRAPPISKEEKTRNIENRAVSELCYYRDHLVWFGEDKILRVLDVRNPSASSERELVKRGSSLTVEADVILVGDKFGDVYAYPLHVDRNNAKIESVSTIKPILGHVSMLTAILLTTKDAHGKQYLVSADRDEHIRVSSYPDCYNIESFCLGHGQFVSALLVPSSDPSLLVSAGGDEFLAIWNWKLGDQRKQIRMSNAVEYAAEVKCEFAVLKILEVSASTLVAVLIEGLDKLYFYDFVEERNFAIDLRGPACDIAVDGARIYVSYQTAAEVIRNFDAFDIDLAQLTAREIDLDELNKTCSSGVKDVSNKHKVHQAALMRKRTKAELEHIRGDASKHQASKKAKLLDSNGSADNELAKEIEADKAATKAKHNTGGLLDT